MSNRPKDIELEERLINNNSAGDSNISTKAFGTKWLTYVSPYQDYFLITTTGGTMLAIKCSTASEDTRDSSADSKPADK